MPGSLNLPFVEIVEHGRLKPPEGSKAAFAAHGVDLRTDHHHLRLGGHRGDPGAGGGGGRWQGRRPLRRLWAEWGSRDDCQAVTGPA